MAAHSTHDAEDLPGATVPVTGDCLVNHHKGTQRAAAPQALGRGLPPAEGSGCTLEAQAPKLPVPGNVSLLSPVRHYMYEFCSKETNLNPAALHGASQTWAKTKRKTETKVSLRETL